MRERLDPESHATEITRSPQGSILLLVRVPWSPGRKFVNGSLVRMSVTRTCVICCPLVAVVSSLYNPKITTKLPRWSLKLGAGHRGPEDRMARTNRGHSPGKVRQIRRHRDRHHKPGSILAVVRKLGNRNLVFRRNRNNPFCGFLSSLRRPLYNPWWGWLGALALRHPHDEVLTLFRVLSVVVLEAGTL